MTNNEIFLGSGASLTFIPELDLYIPITETSGTLGVTAPITAHSDYQAQFLLVNNLYVGCIINRYSSGHAYQSSHRITANTSNTINFSPEVAITSGDYFVIENYGAPTPAPKDGTIKSLLADEWLGIVESATFPTTETELKQVNLSLGGTRNKTFQYKGVETASGGNFGFVSNHAAWLYYFFGKCTGIECTTTALTATPTSLLLHASDANKVLLDTDSSALTDGSTTAFVETGPIFTRSINRIPVPFLNPAIIGGTAGGVLAQPTISNAGTQIEADEAIIENAVINALGGITSTDAEITLTLSAESSTVTFPAEASNYNSGFLTINLASPSGTNGVSTLDVLFNARGATVATSTGNDSVEVLIQNGATGAEIAQSVLTALSGKDVDVTRSGAILTITNKTGGYVGAAHITETTTTATTETMGSVLGGIITGVNLTNAGSSVSGAGDTLTISSNGGTNGILALTATTTATNDLAVLTALTSPTETSSLIDNHIEYTFAEQNGDLLPSFAIEQVFSKLATDTNTYRTETNDANESLNFVKIARGCRVNTMTMTANENEEVKITMDYNTRNVHSLEKTESYEARRGIEDERSFFNYPSPATESTLLEPFFFSDGTFSIFGQSFLKISSFTLTMNNTLTDKRYLGVGSKSIQEAVPAERTYELQFTGYVTDNLLYNELLNQQENTNQNIELIFTKDNGENISLKFKDYMVSANDFPMPDDKGAIEVATTVMPRNLVECKVKTHWILQG